MTVTLSRPTSRFHWVPTAAGWIIGVIATMSLISSVSPFLRHLIKVPREFVDAYLFNFPDTSFAWATVLALLAGALAARKRVAWWALILNLVLAIADTRSITRGAQREHLALAAASKRLSDLEARFGVPADVLMKMNGIPEGSGLKVGQKVFFRVNGYAQSDFEGKVRRMEQWLADRQLGWGDVESTFYSDSMNDVPLLEKVDHPVATNPDPRLREPTFDVEEVDANGVTRYYADCVRVDS